LASTPRRFGDDAGNRSLMSDTTQGIPALPDPTLGAGVSYTETIAGKKISQGQSKSADDFCGPATTPAFQQDLAVLNLTYRKGWGVIVMARAKRRPLIWSSALNPIQAGQQFVYWLIMSVWVDTRRPRAGFL
jgi:hypothetical protein